MYLPSKTLTISIDCPQEKVYEFASDLNNFPKWATSFCRGIKKADGYWIVNTLQGDITLRITAKNQFGVIDHYVTPESGNEIYVPMRVVPNGSGSEMIFTLFRLPGVTDEQYNRDSELVMQDIATLKRVMEENI